jgi:cytochrome c-type biogenesis protein CcmH/NrfF
MFRQRALRLSLTRWTQVRGAVLLSTLLSLALPAFANAETEDERLRRALIISRTTMSPFCPGRTLDSCPSPYATEWRTEIRAMVDKGMTTEEIREALRQRAPQDLSGTPDTPLGGVMPIVATGAAVLLLILLLRSLLSGKKNQKAEEARIKRKATAETPSATSPKDTELDARLKAELDKLDGDGLDERA